MPLENSGDILIADVAGELDLSATSLARLSRKRIITLGNAAELSWNEIAELTHAPDEAAALVAGMWDRTLVGKDGPPQSFVHNRENATPAHKLGVSPTAMALLMHNGIAFRHSRIWHADVTEAARVLSGPDAFVPRPGLGELLNGWYQLHKFVPQEFKKQLAQSNMAMVASQVREDLLALGPLFIPGMPTQLTDRRLTVTREAVEAAAASNSMEQLAIAVGRSSYLSQIAQASRHNNLDALSTDNGFGSSPQQVMN